MTATQYDNNEGDTAKPTSVSAIGLIMTFNVKCVFSSVTRAPPPPLLRQFISLIIGLSGVSVLTHHLL